MVSNLKDGALDRFTGSPTLAREMCGADASVPLSDISVEDFCARVLGRYLDAAIGEIGTNVRIIDYDDINESSIRDVAEFFRLHIPAEPVYLDTVFQQYSKDPTGSRPFNDDRFEKVQAATPCILSAAHRWAIPQYMKLQLRSRIW
jgi:hypothetical protein